MPGEAAGNSTAEFLGVLSMFPEGIRSCSKGRGWSCGDRAGAELRLSPHWLLFAASTATERLKSMLSMEGRSLQRDLGALSSA